MKSKYAGRVFAIYVILLGSLVGNVNASGLWIKNNSNSVSGSSAYIEHVQGATEGYDNNYDAPYNSGNPNPLHFYSVIPDHKLSLDARGLNSTTPFNLDLYNKGFSGTADNFLRFSIYNGNIFEWKNFFLGDASSSNNIVADIKYLIDNSGDGNGIYNLPVVEGTDTGIYDTRKIMVFNYCDLNRDGKVNLEDFGIFANNWQRTGIAKGSNPNALGDYADIDGNGTVEVDDLADFCFEWLWDASDPSTW
jgi:hypothetical protein